MRPLLRYPFYGAQFGGCRMNEFDKQTEPTAFSSRVLTRTKTQKPNIFLGETAKTACCPECGKNEIDYRE